MRTILSTIHILGILKRKATEIIDDILSFYGFKKDRELADLLNIAPNTLSNWRKRNTYDIDTIVNKCPDIDINKLLRGLPLIEENEDNIKFDLTNEPLAIYKLVQEKDRVIITLAEQVGELKEKLRQAEKIPKDT